MARPVIGLSTYREPARWGIWDTSADMLPSVYARSIEVVGGTPVLLPISEPYADAAAAVVERLDGLVICGGADVAPARYGETAHHSVQRSREDRDAWELALLDAAAATALPTLGVCRGMQLMAVHAGGRLHQHLPDVVGHVQHDPGGATFGSTSVRIDRDSLLSSLIGEELAVHCHHHQAVAEHPGFDAVASADDGTVEALELRGDRFCFAVQWHPEQAVDAGLFAALVAAGSAYAGR